MRKITVPIRGMHCRSCEILIEQKLKDVHGVVKVNVSHKTGVADVFYGRDLPQTDAIKTAVREAGYDVGAKDKLTWFSKNIQDYRNLFTGAFILLILYLVARWAGLFEFGVNTQSTSLLVVLVVGLVAGISTCMALVGGLVLGLSARHAELHPEMTAAEKFRPHLFFNLGRVIGFGVLGGVIGLIGSTVKLSPTFLGLMTILVGGVMLFLGLKLVGIFPKLQEKSLSLPKSVAKFFGLKTDQKEYSHRSAFLTGALTFFLPCGFTQAMQLYAVSSGSLWQGAVIMSLFAFGTAPGLLGIGGLASVFKGKKAKIFFAGAGLAVVLLGWFNITNGAGLIAPAQGQGSAVLATSTGIQEIRMEQNGSGYSPNTFTVEKGKKVRWIINSTNQFSCASSIFMPKYKIYKYLTKGENIIEFVPTEAGEIPFSCSMNMYRGKFIVVDSLGSAAPNNQAGSNNLAIAGAPAGGSCGSGGGGCGCGGGGAKKAIDPTATVAAAAANEQVITATYTLATDISPNKFQVKKGIPVRFEIDVKDSGQGCMSSLMVQGLYNQPQYLQAGTKMVLAFTPDRVGEYDITCAMGVPRGQIVVTE